MDLKSLDLKKTFRPTEENQWESNKAVQRAIVCGKLLERFDKDDEKGCHSGMFVEYECFEFMIRMTNGDGILGLYGIAWIVMYTKPARSGLSCTFINSVALSFL